MSRARRVLLSLLGLVLCGPPPSARARHDAIVLPIVFHVAAVDGRDVVQQSFLTERLARADEIYAAHGVAFSGSAVRPLDASHAALETREDRDALGAEVEPGVINCFVVGSLRDVDDPSQMRRGVHWHDRTRPGTHFVILSSIAGPNVLAHELGHFLGNPAHSEAAGNLMSTQRVEGLPVLDADQARRLARRLRSYLKSGELRAVEQTRP